jgi:hypothetical protein
MSEAKAPPHPCRMQCPWKVGAGLLLMLAALPASVAQVQSDNKTPEANPGRPTVSNPATLSPVGYIQIETGALGATDSGEFETYVEWNEVLKLAVTQRLEFTEASAPVVRTFVQTMTSGITSNDSAEIFLGAQLVLLPGQGVKPTLAVSYSHRAYNGPAPDLDAGSPRNGLIFYASADVKGFHYDANAIFNEVTNYPVDRLQFGQTLSISHPIGKGFTLAGEIWRFSQPFLRSNAVGNLWAISYAARKNLVFDAGFNRGLTATSTQWEAFAGLTYVIPRRLW